MAQNLASLTLTPADATALRGAIATIRTTLGARAVSLTPQQRQTLIKMGDKTRNFCEQAVPALQANATSLPADFPLAGLVQDLADYQALVTIYSEFLTVAETLDDTLKALASDVMVNAIYGVGILKAVNKVKPSLDKLLKDLNEVRRTKTPKKAPKPKP